MSSPLGFRPISTSGALIRCNEPPKEENGRDSNTVTASVTIGNQSAIFTPAYSPSFSKTLNLTVEEDRSPREEGVQTQLPSLFEPSLDSQQYSSLPQSPSDSPRFVVFHHDQGNRQKEVISSEPFTITVSNTCTTQSPKMNSRSSESSPKTSDSEDDYQSCESGTQTPTSTNSEPSPDRKPHFKTQHNNLSHSTPPHRHRYLETKSYNIPKSSNRFLTRTSTKRDQTKLTESQTSPQLPKFSVTKRPSNVIIEKNDKILLRNDKIFQILRNISKKLHATSSAKFSISGEKIRLFCKDEIKKLEVELKKLILSFYNDAGVIDNTKLSQADQTYLTEVFKICLDINRLIFSLFQFPNNKIKSALKPIDLITLFFKPNDLTLFNIPNELKIEIYKEYCKNTYYSLLRSEEVSLNYLDILKSSLSFILELKPDNKMNENELSRLKRETAVIVIKIAELKKIDKVIDKVNIEKIFLEKKFAINNLDLIEKISNLNERNLSSDIQKILLEINTIISADNANYTDNQKSSLIQNFVKSIPEKSNTNFWNNITDSLILEINAFVELSLKNVIQDVNKYEGNNFSQSFYCSQDSLEIANKLINLKETINSLSLSSSSLKLTGILTNHSIDSYKELMVVLSKNLNHGSLEDEYKKKAGEKLLDLEINKRSIIDIINDFTRSLTFKNAIKSFFSKKHRSERNETIKNIKILKEKIEAIDEDINNEEINLSTQIKFLNDLDTARENYNNKLIKLTKFHDLIPKTVSYCMNLNLEINAKDGADDFTAKVEDFVNAEMNKFSDILEDRNFPYNIKTDDDIISTHIYLLLISILSMFESEIYSGINLTEQQQTEYMNVGKTIINKGIMLPKVYNYQNEEASSFIYKYSLSVTTFIIDLLNKYLENKFIHDKSKLKAFYNLLADYMRTIFTEEETEQLKLVLNIRERNCFHSSSIPADLANLRKIPLTDEEHNSRVNRILYYHIEKDNQKILFKLKDYKPELSHEDITVELLMQGNILTKDDKHFILMKNENKYCGFAIEVLPLENVFVGKENLKNFEISATNPIKQICIQSPYSLPQPLPQVFFPSSI